METGQCLISLIPLRAENSERSEQVSQLLFGETYEILDRTEKWAFIRTIQDNYKGWIDLKLVSKKQFEPDLKKVHSSLPKFVDVAGKKILISPGSYLPEMPLDSVDILELFKTHCGIPYVWGGKSFFGLDCSGLVQTYFRCLGIELPRDAYQQANMGTTIHLLEESQTNDLAFFDNSEGKITHVGIIIRNMDHFSILHASGELRIDTMDYHGVHKKNAGYSHSLRLIQRILI
ncbi:MAG: NlpC/P60 family protein [Bacteroidota bacterium]